MDKSERTSTRGKKTVGKLGRKSISSCAPSIGVSNQDSGDGDMLIEDENTWECSVCTYRNSQEAFKCLMCDVCKGTSTRKPRYNHDAVAQQVKKQQLQIHQKLLKSSARLSSSNEAKDSGESYTKDPEKVDGKETKSNKESKESKISPKEDDLLGETRGHPNSNHPSPKESKVRESKAPKEGRVKNVKGNGRSSSKHNSFDGIDEAGPSVKSSSPTHHQNNSSTTASAYNNANSNHHKSHQPSSPDLNHNRQTNILTTPSTLSKVAKSRENKVKSAKSSLLKMKNIDRNNFLAQAVTVNNVTVIITEFQPKKKMKTTATKKLNRLSISKKEED